MAAKNLWAAKAYIVTSDNLTEITVTVQGRDRWALEQLMRAGPKGCTPLRNPAPRWSAYIHNLRRLGVDIETLHEQHTGPFAGTHGRYVLRCVVTPAYEAEDAA